jgi:hypothetical protein
MASTIVAAHKRRDTMVTTGESDVESGGQKRYDHSTLSLTRHFTPIKEDWVHS